MLAVQIPAPKLIISVSKAAAEAKRAVHLQSDVSQPEAIHRNLYSAGILCESA